LVYKLHIKRKFSRNKGSPDEGDLLSREFEFEEDDFDMDEEEI